MSEVASRLWDAVRHKTGEVALAVVVLTLGVAGAAVVLRGLNRRARALRHQVLAVAAASIAVGAVVAAALGRLMVLETTEARAATLVLACTAVIATALVWIASAPLGADVRRLETTVRRIEAGERDMRCAVVRSDELGHVGRALDELTARLATLEAERAGVEAERRAILSSLSHDLRTPLSALRAAVEALADGVAPDPERYLRSMRRDVEALSGLVDDLFLITTLDAGRLELFREPVDLTEIADGAVEAMAPVATAKQTALRLGSNGHVRVSGNAVALGRVIRNLLDNAIRHAPEGSTVTVVVEAGRSATVRVIDEGPGFPASFAEHAFEQFSRADPSRTRGTGGAGLGLAIARGLVEAHGGRIWIEQSPGGQVAFSVPVDGTAAPRSS